MTTPPPEPPPAPPHPRHHFWPVLWSRIQFALSLALTVGFLLYLLWSPPGHTHDPPPPRNAGGEVALAGPRLIRVTPGTPLANRLEIVPLRAVTIRTPRLSVTGVVAASLRPGKGGASDYWQFNTPELLNVYTDWQKAIGDVAFAEKELEAVRDLAEARVRAQEKVVERLRKLVEAGTEGLKALAAEETALLEYQIQGRKEAHEAQTALLVARRDEAALVRRLQQAGLDPGLLRAAAEPLDIIMAEAPEVKASLVKLGQGCEARFFSLPDRTFAGTVNGMSPVVSADRRSLRVLFTVDDPDDLLHPGMFADIGLGTDSREALLVTPDAVLHAGRSDYVLVAAGGDNWRITEVEVGEAQGREVEVLSGLKAGDRIIGQGSILLKPYLVQALELTAAQQARAAGGGAGS